MKTNFNEKELLKLIKIVPIILVVIFSVVTTSILINSNIIENKKNLNNLKENFTNEQKRIVKQEVLRVVKKINYQKKILEQKLKDDLKNRTYSVYQIIQNIYNENIDKSKDEITKMIKDAIRPIRFNNQRGYFFISQTDGKIILHPIITNLEGENLWNLKDTKGTYLIREHSKIAKNKKEGYLTWYWTKPQGDNKTYKKIGFTKYFEPLDWFISTGEYVVDFEKEIKQALVDEIKGVRFEKNGYIFIHQYDGLCLSHIKEKNIGKYRLKLQDKNKNFLVKDIINKAKDGGGFIEYIGTVMPSTGLPARKVSYIAAIDDWQWQIGAGAYISDIDIVLLKKGEEFQSKLSQKILIIICSSIVLTIILIYFMWMFAKNIKIEFKKYKISLNESSKKLNYHKDILQTIVDIQQELISNSEFNSSVEYILKELINILNVDRVYIFKNHLEGDKLLCSQKFEYTKNNISSELNNPNLQNVSYKDMMPRWGKELSSKNLIEGLVKDFPETEREILENQNIKSLLIMPIFFENRWWGFIGFDDCSSERKWSDLEKDILEIISNSFISALMEDNYYKSLEKKVQTQIKDIRKRDNMLIQQSKMASMGEMIGNIAHQWRQPLNLIGSLLVGLELKYENNLLNDQYMKKYIDKINHTIQTMSSTIDDFRNFFLPTKKKENFNIKESIVNTLSLLGESYNIHNIKVTILSNKEFNINGYKNEFTQAVLVILNNSKDAIVENKISNGTIKIDIVKNQNFVDVVFYDNGGGIPVKILNKIFEPYFTTKFKSQGTGIGLYMVKEIIEKHMQGEVYIENFKKGVKTTFRFKNIS